MRLRQFNWLQLSDATALEPAQFKDFLQVLRIAGYLQMEPPTGRGSRAIWTLVRDTGVETPRLRPDGTPLPPSGQQRLWAAIKVLQVFDVEGLSIGSGVPVSTAKRYATALTSAGYLVCQAGRYRLLPGRVTGPRAPAIRRGKRVYDPNLGREITAETWGELRGRRR